MAKVLELAFVGCGAISRFHLAGIRDRAALDGSALARNSSCLTLRQSIYFCTSDA